jgi:hypothetical protein
VQYALFEEHCRNFVGALQTYERGLEFVSNTDKHTHIEANLCAFMLRMDELCERASSGQCGARDVEALSLFAGLIDTREKSHHVKHDDVLEESIAKLVTQDVVTLMAQAGT